MFPNTTNVSSIVPHVCIDNQCNTTLQKNQTHTNERYRQSNLCPHLGKMNPRPRKSSLMFCVDFFFWKTPHLLDQNMCLSLALLVKVSHAHNHIANALRETWGNDERLCFDQSGQLRPAAFSRKNTDSIVGPALVVLFIVLLCVPAAYTGQQTTTNGQNHVTIVRNPSILNHQNGVTQMDLMTSIFLKKLTGTRITRRPATTTTTTMPSLNTTPHFWINLSKHEKKIGTTSRPCRKRWLRQMQQQT